MKSVVLIVPLIYVSTGEQYGITLRHTFEYLQSLNQLLKILLKLSSQVRRRHFQRKINNGSLEKILNDVLNSHHCLFPTEFHHPSSRAHNTDFLKCAQFWKISAWKQLLRKKLWLWRTEKLNEKWRVKTLISVYFLYFQHLVWQFSLSFIV